MFGSDFAQKFVNMELEENLQKCGIFYGLPIGMNKKKEAHEIFDKKIAMSHIALIEDARGGNLLVYREAFQKLDTAERMKSWIKDCEQKAKPLFEDMTKNMDFFKEKPSNDWEPRIFVAFVTGYQFYYI